MKVSKEERNTTTVIFVDKKQYKVEESEMNGKNILSLKGLSSNEFELYLIKGNDSEKINPTQTISLENGMHFKSILKDINFG